MPRIGREDFPPLALHWAAAVAGPRRSMERPVAKRRVAAARAVDATGADSTALVQPRAVAAAAANLSEDVPPGP